MCLKPTDVSIILLFWYNECQDLSSCWNAVYKSKTSMNLFSSVCTQIQAAKNTCDAIALSHHHQNREERWINEVLKCTHKLMNLSRARSWSSRIEQSELISACFPLMSVIRGHSSDDDDDDVFKCCQWIFPYVMRQGMMHKMLIIKVIAHFLLSYFISISTGYISTCQLSVIKYWGTVIVLLTLL